MYFADLCRQEDTNISRKTWKTEKDPIDTWYCSWLLSHWEKVTISPQQAGRREESKYLHIDRIVPLAKRHLTLNAHGIVVEKLCCRGNDQIWRQIMKTTKHEAGGGKDRKPNSNSLLTLNSVIYNMYSYCTHVPSQKWITVWRNLQICRKR